MICQIANGEDAISKAHELQPDLIPSDISLPGISGIEAAPQILRVSPNSRIIFLSQHDTVHMANEAMEAGGRGYVTKGEAALELLKAVRSVRRGNRFVSQRIVEQGWMPEVSPATECPLACICAPQTIGGVNGKEQAQVDSHTDFPRGGINAHVVHSRP